MPGGGSFTQELTTGIYTITAQFEDGNEMIITSCEQEFVIDNAQCLPPECDNNQNPPFDIEFCSWMPDPSGCAQEVIEFYFTNEGLGASNFDVRYFKVTVKTLGDATLNPVETQILANLPVQPTIHYLPDGQTAEFIISCEYLGFSDSYAIPFGDCDNPFIRIGAISFPDSEIEFDVNAEGIFDLHSCQFNEICTFVNRDAHVDTADEPFFTLSDVNYLFDVIVGGNGCMNGVTIINAEIGFSDGSVCSPEDMVNSGASSVLSLCPGCEDKFILGDVKMEDGEDIVNVQFDVAISGSSFPTTNCNPLTGPCNASFNNGEDCNSPGYSHNLNCPSELDELLVTPFKDDCVLEGVTTFDMVLIRKHILGVELFDSPYKFIAGDVNNSNSVSTLDLVALRKVILLIEPNFQNNTSWRFVPESYEFLNPLNPLLEEFPECGFADFSQSEEQTVNFVAIKIGDVNNSAKCVNCDEMGELVGVDDRAGEQLPLNLIGKRQLESEESTILSFQFEKFSEKVAFQLGVEFDKNYLEIEEVLIGAIPDQTIEGNFGLNEKKQGIIRTLWHSSNGENINWRKPTNVFSVKVKALTDISNIADFVSLKNQVLRNLAFDENGHPFSIDLKFTPMEETTLNQLIVKPIPNPFKEDLSLSVFSAEKEKADIVIFNLLGAPIATYQFEFSEGWNKINIPDAQHWKMGVYTYSIESPNQSATGKIIKQ